MRVASELEVDRGRSGAVKPPGTHVASEVEVDRGRLGVEKPSGTHVASEVVVEGDVAGWSAYGQWIGVRAEWGQLRIRTEKRSK